MRSLVSVLHLLEVSIHSVAAEIAGIHNINLDKIINKLTEVCPLVSYIPINTHCYCVSLPPAMAAVHQLFQHRYECHTSKTCLPSPPPPLVNELNYATGGVVSMIMAMAQKIDKTYLYHHYDKECQLEWSYYFPIRIPNQKYLIHNSTIMIRRVYS